MAQRKSYEERAFTKARSRSRRIRKAIEEIACDFADSDANWLSHAAESLAEALDVFDSELRRAF